MSTSYAANLKRMQDVIHEMQAIDQQLQTALATLNEEAQAELRYWTYDSADAYRRAKSVWDAKAQKMQRDVTTAQEALTHIQYAINGGEVFGTGLWNG